MLFSFADSKTSEEDLVSIYSGTFADFSKARPQIYRPSVYTKDGKLAYDYLKTAPSSSKWLNGKLLFHPFKWFCIGKLPTLLCKWFI